MTTRKFGHGTCTAADYELYAWISYKTHLVRQRSWESRILYDTWPLIRWK